MTWGQVNQLVGEKKQWIFPIFHLLILNFSIRNLFQKLIVSIRRSCYVLISKGTCSSKICSGTCLNMIMRDLFKQNMQRDLFKGYINNTNNRGTCSKTASKAHKATSTIFEGCLSEFTQGCINTKKNRSCINMTF